MHEGRANGSLAIAAKNGENAGQWGALQGREDGE